MRLTAEQSPAMLEKFGCYVTEVCDRCGTAIHYANRFTIRGVEGEWCSRECRDGLKAHEPGTCQHCKAKLSEDKRHGTVFCDDACRKAAQRASRMVQTVKTAKLSRTKPSIYAVFSSEKLPDGMSGYAEAESAAADTP